MTIRAMLALTILLAAAPAAAAPVEGAAVYAKDCASCHGADGKGSGKNPAVAGKSATLVKEVMELHPPPMNKMKISGAALDAVATYIAGLKN